MLLRVEYVSESHAQNFYCSWLGFHQSLQYYPNVQCQNSCDIVSDRIYCLNCETDFRTVLVSAKVDRNTITYLIILHGTAYEMINLVSATRLRVSPRTSCLTASQSATTGKPTR